MARPFWSTLASASRPRHHRRSRQVRPRRTTHRLLIEPLEQRALLAVDISIADGSAIEGDHTAHYRGPFVQVIPPAAVSLPAFGPDGNLFTVALAGASKGAIDRYAGATGAFIDHFVPPGSVTTGRDMGFNGGYLYIGEESIDDVLRFDATTGAFDSVFVTAGSGGIDGPHGLVFGPDANGDNVPELYVSGRDGFNVVRYDGVTGQPLGTYVTSGSGGLSWPEGLTFDSSGTYLYVASTGSSQVLKYDAQTGAYVGVAASGLIAPKDVTFGFDGLLYVASDNRIARFTAAGTYVDDYVPAGSGGMSQLSRLTFGPDGNLYVTTSGSASDRMYRFGTESEAIFTVSISSPSSLPVTVDFSTADGSAASGSDYTTTTGTVTFEPGVTAKTILVPLLDDAVAETPETFAVNLSNAVEGIIIDGDGVGTIIDNDTKFYVVDDASTNRNYEYGDDGTQVENYDLNGSNTSPRGAASNAAGDKVWVVDANKNVYVYNASGGLLGSWTAGSLAPNAAVKGIATDGTDIWIVDAKSDKVFKYAGAATRLSGSQSAASSFALNSGNKDAADVVTDGSFLWVVNDSTTDKVFKYTLAGSLAGSWTITAGGGSPTGITVDPAAASHVWIVDSAADRVYQYDNAVSRTSGSQAASNSFALATGNTNPQGIADPPVGRLEAGDRRPEVAGRRAEDGGRRIVAGGGIGISSPGITRQGTANLVDALFGSGAGRSSPARSALALVCSGTGRGGATVGEGRPTTASAPRPASQPYAAAHVHLAPALVAVLHDVQALLDSEEDEADQDDWWKSGEAASVE